MAVYAKSGTTVANTEADPIIVGPQHNYIEVMNATGTAEIWFTINGSTPSAQGDDCYCVPASISSFKVEAPSGQATVRLLSTGVQRYSVIGSQT